MSDRDDYLSARIERREQAKGIAHDWILRIERLQSSSGATLKSLGLARTRRHSKYQGKELKAEELYCELGRSFLVGLIDMRRSSRLYTAHAKGERNEQVVRESAEFMLLQAIGLIWSTNHYLDLQINLEPLLRLQRAISEVAHGSNDRLLVTGEFADRLVGKRFSRSTRRCIEVRAAAVVELLLRHGHAKTQIAAATLVATTLKGAGFRSPGRDEQSLSPDTIKRWHNNAKKVLKLADRTSFEAWTSPIHDVHRSSHDTYLSMLMRYESPMIEQLRLSLYPELSEFDPDRELTDLANRCWEARTYD